MQRRVRTLWTDLNGLTHGRYIPSSRFDHATHHAVTTLAMSPEGEILPITGYAADVGFPDLAAVPLADDAPPGLGARHRRRRLRAARRRRPAAAAVPARRAGARRRRLARASASSRSSASSSSCTCSSRDDAAAGGARPAARATACTASGSAATRRVWPWSSSTPSRRWTSTSRACSPSSRPGRWRSTSATGRPLAAADAAQLVKEMTREVAARRGYRATYMGRPDALSVGSGLHVNMSLVPVSGGANALHDPAKPEGLSSLARQASAG